MKKIFCILIAFSLYCLPAFAADGYPPAAALAGSSIPTVAPTEMDYLSPTVIPLTPKEVQALRLSDNWVRHEIQPYMAGGGKLMYVHGASMPTIIASPMQVCDVELESGETINEIVIGDSARWMVESGMAGNTVHLFIKPVDSGLESSAIVTTDRRVYHLRLVSQRNGHTPYVGFSYVNDLRRSASQQQSAAAKQQLWQSTSVDGQQMSLENLNFNYEVKGKARWKPERVYDDGR